jgi:hypothetical protein
MPIDHVVKQGDCLSSLALEYGFLPETIWNDPANAELKQKRKNMSILFEGDIVVIPDKRLREESRPTTARHVFKRKGVPEILQMTLQDFRYEPRKNVKYTITIDGQTEEGQTDANGHLQHPIPPNAREGKLVVHDGGVDEEYPLNLGYLDPITEVSGVQKRLSSLGFDCGEVDGILGPKTEQAISEFQVQHKLDPTGEVDDKTRQKLKEVYGS